MTTNPVPFNPPRPILVWDGECNFCRLCAERFDSHIENKVDLIPYQSLHKKWPQAPAEDYVSAVYLFTPAGKSYRAAAAVYRFYAEYPWRGWAFWAYKRFRWFAVLSEWGYRFVANNGKGPLGDWRAFSGVRVLCYLPTVQAPGYMAGF
ncbi:MAG: hypothetical protein CM1200mP10_29300 [Candidatus Neomarinimicrobiota bacterium]|nr:MAG: hypothetical protein CM1200mP10_29300 [Candidatus Neomarinimicrobiota bacterium]